MSMFGYPRCSQKLCYLMDPDLQPLCMCRRFTLDAPIKYTSQVPLNSVINGNILGIVTSM